MKIHLRDQLQIESTRELTPEGYLKATAAITMVGVQQYPFSQFGGDSDEPVGVLRPPETVFHPETISSVKLKPVTISHPHEDVGAGNHSRLSVGSVGEIVEPIDEFRLGASIIINEESVVKNIFEKKIDELSLGYDSQIVKEQGEYNGESYNYIFDGPMIVNHLAIVEEGRCGDTVRILDGGNLMKKKQAIKFLKDAGLSDSKLSAFMEDKKDDADVDSDVFVAALQDIDMEGMMPLIVKNLMPMIEKEIKGNKGFMAILAKEVAGSMTAPSAPADAEPEPEPEPEKTPEEIAADAKKKEEEITDAATKRANLIDSAKVFIQDKNIHTLTNREILESTLGGFLKAEDMQDKTDDYLQGMLDSITSDRKKANDFFKKINVTDSNDNLSQPFTGLQIKNLEDEGGK